MQVGIYTHTFQNWGGGIDFLRNIILCLKSVENPPSISVYSPLRGFRRTSFNLSRMIVRGAKSLMGKSLSHWSNEGLIRTIKGELDDRDTFVEIDTGFRSLARSAAMHSCDIILPLMTPPPPEFRTPWIGYIFDFQHEYLPHFFSSQDIQSRRVAFEDLASSANDILVNSRAVKEDAERFLKRCKSTIHQLPFYACPNESWFRDTAPSRFKYRLTDPYFIVCNQFWKHKDHECLFRAFKLFTQDFPCVRLACTGIMEDTRDPSYIQNLRRLIDQLSLTDRIVFLGHIPKLEQIDLMRSAVANVQPTLFEGGPGGGSTFDAIAVGQRSILSDIPINKELEGSLCYYFKAGDPSSLRDAMIACSKESTAPTNHEHLMLVGKNRRRACGEAILNIAKSRL